MEEGMSTTSTKTLYTAEATVTGGRSEGSGHMSDGMLEVTLRLPPEMGGEGGGTNPEQLFAVGYAACFESALGVVARRRRQEVGTIATAGQVGPQDRRLGPKRAESVGYQTVSAGAPGDGGSRPTPLGKRDSAALE
jgi:organic hydroperoxide reductase OsmC/OhrA